MNGRGLDARGVEGEGEEANGDVEYFAGDFVFVDLRLFSYCSWEWEGMDVRRTAISGGWGSGRADLGCGSFLASNSCWPARDSNGRWRCRLG
jgi:hypothetical protein